MNKKFLIIIILIIIGAGIFIWQYSGMPGKGIQDKNWICGNILDYKGQSYNTVKIGEQCWFAENLNAGEMIINEKSTDNGVIEKYCYNDESSNCDIYGGLYLWDEAMQYVKKESSQGICPNGWHLPSDDEWEILEGEVDSNYSYGDGEWNDRRWRGEDVGNKLKSLEYWNLGEDSTNSSGFTILPAGYRNLPVPGGSFAGFSELGESAYFWSSTEELDFTSWVRVLYYYRAEVYRNGDSRSRGFSVRCVKD